MNEYIFFCSHKDINTGFLSNWYTNDKGSHFTSTEQSFMYKKAKYFNDQQTAEFILKSNDPKEIKKLGREVKNFNEEDWNIYKYHAMYMSVFDKFKNNKELAYKLKDTKNKILVEAANYDRIWGIGYNKENALENKDNWGSNLLGKVLMEVRREL